MDDPASGLLIVEQPIVADPVDDHGLQPRAKANGLHDLPEEIVLNVVSHMSALDLLAFSCTSRAMNRLGIQYLLGTRGIHKPTSYCKLLLEAGPQPALDCLKVLLHSVHIKEIKDLSFNYNRHYSYSALVPAFRRSLRLLRRLTWVQDVSLHFGHKGDEPKDEEFLKEIAGAVEDLLNEMILKSCRKIRVFGSSKGLLGRVYEYRKNPVVESLPPPPNPEVKEVGLITENGARGEDTESGGTVTAQDTVEAAATVEGTVEAGRTAAVEDAGEMAEANTIEAREILVTTKTTDEVVEVFKTVEETVEEDKMVQDTVEGGEITLTQDTVGASETTGVDNSSKPEEGKADASDDTAIAVETETEEIPTLEGLVGTENPVQAEVSNDEQVAKGGVKAEDVVEAEDPARIEDAGEADKVVQAENPAVAEDTGKREDEARAQGAVGLEDVTTEDACEVEGGVQTGERVNPGSKGGATREDANGAEETMPTENATPAEDTDKMGQEVATKNAGASEGITELMATNGSDDTEKCVVAEEGNNAAETKDVIKLEEADNQNCSQDKSSDGKADTPTNPDTINKSTATDDPDTSDDLRYDRTTEGGSRIYLRCSPEALAKSQLVHFNLGTPDILRPPFSQWTFAMLKASNVRSFSFGGSFLPSSDSEELEFVLRRLALALPDIRWLYIYDLESSVLLELMRWLGMFASLETLHIKPGSSDKHFSTLQLPGPAPCSEAPSLEPAKPLPLFGFAPTLHSVYGPHQFLKYLFSSGKPGKDGEEGKSKLEFPELEKVQLDYVCTSEVKLEFGILAEVLRLVKLALPQRQSLDTAVTVHIKFDKYFVGLSPSLCNGAIDPEEISSENAAVLAEVATIRLSLPHERERIARGGCDKMILGCLTAFSGAKDLTVLSKEYSDKRKEDLGWEHFHVFKARGKMLEHVYLRDTPQ